MIADQISRTLPLIQRSPKETKRSVMNPDSVVQLGEKFQPDESDIICGRGKRAWDHPGNVRFRQLLESKGDEYCNARTKLDKSILVSEIMNAIEDNNGRFVKEDEEGSWTTVSLATAREKVGQGFRDLLHAKYKSSSKGKTNRRRMVRKGERMQRQTSDQSSNCSLSSCDEAERDLDNQFFEMLQRENSERLRNLKNASPSPETSCKQQQQQQQQKPMDEIEPIRLEEVFSPNAPTIEEETASFLLECFGEPTAQLQFPSALALSHADVDMMMMADLGQ